jgi:hypothetical protein
MALLLGHHYDYYGDTTKWRAAAKTVSADCTYQTNTGRWSGGCLKADALGFGDRVALKASPGTNMIRCAGSFRTTNQVHGTSGTYRPFIRFQNAALNRYWGIWLSAFSASTWLYASPFDDAENTGAVGGAASIEAYGLADGYWHSFEFALSASTTVGSFKMWLDGEEMTDVTITSASTSAAASGDVTGLTDVWMCSASSNVIASSGGGNTWLDDFIVWDDTGSDFVGEIGEEIRMRALPPDEAGTVSGWTPLSSTNFSNVDDTAQDNDTTYNSATAVGLEDRYGIAAFPVTPDFIKGVFVESVVRTATGQCFYNNRLKSAAELRSGTSIFVTTAYVSQIDCWGKNPNGNINWTKAAVEAAEFGVYRD